jgi:hypothetical protein
MPVMFFDCLRSALPDQKLFDATENSQLDVWLRLFEVSGAYLFYSNFCYVCPFPAKYVLDEDGRWHNRDGPSCEFHDGQKIYHWHGTPIPEFFITRKKWFVNPMSIDLQPNLEWRRILIEIYGLDKYLQRSMAKKIHRDEYGILYRKATIPGADPIVAVAVKNSTAEPDGTFKTYFLRVPPTIKTAKEAVAWTFGLSQDEYKPEQQT